MYNQLEYYHNNKTGIYEKLFIFYQEFELLHIQETTLIITEFTNSFSLHNTRLKVDKEVTCYTFTRFINMYFNFISHYILQAKDSSASLVKISRRSNDNL